MEDMQVEKEPTLANQPENCVGPRSESAGKASACNGCENQSICASGVLKQADPDIPLINSRMAQIKHKILVFSVCSIFLLYSQFLI